MYGKSMGKSISILRLLLLVVCNVISLLLVKEKNIYYWVLFAIFNVFFLVSFVDLIKIKNHRSDTLFKLPQFQFLYSMLIVLITSYLAFSIFYKILLQSLLFIIIVYGIIAVVYVISLSVLFHSTNYVQSVENHAKSSRDFARLIKEELNFINSIGNLSSNAKQKLEIIMEFISYNMTINSNNDAKIYEQQLSNALSILKGEVLANNEENILFILNEIHKILLERNRALSFNK